MTSNQSHIPLSGSSRKPMRGAKAVAPIAGDERFQVTVHVRRKQELPSANAIAEQVTQQRRHLTHAELSAAHGADPQDLAKVKAFAEPYGLVVVGSYVDRCTVVLSGTAEQFSKAFGVTLEHYEHSHGTYRGRKGDIQIPADLAPIVRGVFGLDNRPVARPHLRLRPLASLRAAPPPGTFTPPELAALYNFPAGVNGSGQCIAIIELGGGFRPTDLKAYFQDLEGTPPPPVRAVSVDQGQNTPTGDPGGPDGEVMLDIEVAGAVAPGAAIAVYFAPNTDQSYLNAVKAAVNDQTNSPSVISTSWGGPEPEDAQGQTWMQLFTETLQAAASLGITFCAAAGDDGAADMTADIWDNRAHVDFPASSPFALGCGGTSLTASAGAIQSESVWNQHGVDPQSQSFGATGGGISTFFPVPDYQAGLQLPPSANEGAGPGRGVPDVAADADPNTGYFVRVDGKSFPIGGTSAAAPLWAGLIALLNQKRSARAGFINPTLYAKSVNGLFNDIIDGNNEVGAANIGYVSGPGWDACTGLGTPNGVKILAALGS